MSQALKNNSKVTIYEIAREAGVSSSTVARVLRGDVKETWKSTAKRAERIRKLAHEMGYRTNWRARAFSEQRTRTVGFVSTSRIDILEGVHGHFMSGFNTTLHAQNYQLLFVHTESDQFEDIMLGSRLDGCALFEHLPDRAREVVQQSGMPTVLLNNAADPEFERIVIDEIGGGYQAAKHLIDLGHTQVAFYVNVDADRHYSIAQRYEGVNAAMREAGLPEATFYELDDEGMDAVLASADRPTGLVCYSHAEALPVLCSLYRMGLRVPDAISLVCFNDVYPTQVTCPPLTTISHDSRRLGKVGAQLLLRRIHGDQPTTPRSYTLKNQTVPRQSSGPPPAKP